MLEENQPAAAEAVEPQSPEQDEDESGQIRPDPAFKEYTAEQARKAGLELRNVELPQLSLSDLVLAVPNNTRLVGTMFDFFAKVNVVEFKSENDPLTLRKLGLNQARAWLIFDKDPKLKLENLMSVFVCAQQPRMITRFLERKAINYRAEQKWLLRCDLGGIEVAIVICRLLPLERRYYWWLMFAPVSSQKWANFVTMLVEQGDLEMLKVVAKIRPVEVSAMTIEANRKPRKRSAKEEEALNNMLHKMYQELLIVTKDNPEARAKVLQMRPPDLTAAQIIAYLTPEERLAGLGPEERLADLTVEQRLAGLGPEERLADLTVEQRLAGLEPEQRLADLTPEQRLAGLEPEQRLAGLEPEQIVETLTPAQRQKLLGLLS